MEPINETRLEALGMAVRNKLRDETATDVVKSAEKYLAFLQGNSTDGDQ